MTGQEDTVSRPDPTREALTPESERTLRRDIERGGPVTPGDVILLLNTLDACRRRSRSGHPMTQSDPMRCAKCGEVEDRGVHDTAERCDEVHGPCLDPGRHHRFAALSTTPAPSLSTREQEERAKWRANERADRNAAAADYAARVLDLWLTGDSDFTEELVRGTIDKVRSAIGPAVTVHVPDIEQDPVNDAAWLTCSCGWDASAFEAGGWPQHFGAPHDPA